MNLPSIYGYCLIRHDTRSGHCYFAIYRNPLLNVPGRPIQYKTTPDFLRTFGLSSLEELPPIDKIAFGEPIELPEEEQGPQEKAQGPQEAT